MEECRTRPCQVKMLDKAAIEEKVSEVPDHATDSGSTADFRSETPQEWCSGWSSVTSQSPCMSDSLPMLEAPGQHSLPIGESEPDSAEPPRRSRLLEAMPVKEPKPPSYSTERENRVPLLAAVGGTVMLDNASKMVTRSVDAGEGSPTVAPSGWLFSQSQGVSLSALAGEEGERVLLGGDAPSLHVASADLPAIAPLAAQMAPGLAVAGDTLGWAHQAMGAVTVGTGTTVSCEAFASSASGFVHMAQGGPHLSECLGCCVHLPWCCTICNICFLTS